MAGRSPRKKQKGGAAPATDSRVAEMKASILQIESFLNEASGMAAAEMERIDEMMRGLEETVARVQAGTTEREEIVREREPALQELDGRIRELEGQLKEKEKLLESRAQEVSDLRSRVEGLEASRESAVLFDEENVVLLEDVESLPGDEVYSVGPVEETRQALEAGGQPERKMKVIEESMRGVVTKSAQVVARKGAEDEKKATLLSLLSPTKKR